MLEENTIEWERVDGSSCSIGAGGNVTISRFLKRTKVPGGWLYREVVTGEIANHALCTSESMGVPTTALCFVPDAAAPSAVATVVNHAETPAPVVRKKPGPKPGFRRGKGKA